MSDTTTTAGYLRRTGEWIVIGGLPLIVESIAWTVVLACFIALLIVQTARKRRRGLPMIFIFLSHAREILLQVVGDEGKITPADKALHLNAQKNVCEVLAVGTGSWLVSILLGDLVVFWRAWELSSHNLAAKRMLVCPAAFLLSYTGTIPVVLVCQLQALVNWCLSLLSNLLSTCVIAYIGWRRRSVGERILGLIAESGFIYFSVNRRMLSYSIYGSLWDTISEHSGLESTPNHVTTSIRFATISRISPEASLESPESVPHGNQDVSKETLRS
ncbi:hypothetical protein BDZ89DRAFT_1087716, partial [Hymenopellis radicata]